MDEATRQQAIALISIANSHLSSAWNHVVGRPLPLTGVQSDFDQALTELRLLQEKTAEAIQLIESKIAQTK